MSEARPFCLWVTPGRGQRGLASYALPSRYSSAENARRALRRQYPTGRTSLGSKVRVGNENGTIEEDS